jgi:RimJ/RimL family protein N-acetyltransferase
MLYLDTLLRLKNLPAGTVRLPAPATEGRVELVLLTRDRISDTPLMELLSAWRKKHEFWFQAVFPVSVENTRRWYEKQLMDTPDRVLFLIEENGAPIGHIGFFRFDPETQTCEIDNIVRGEEGRKGLMEASLRVLMAWGRETLGLRGYSLQVVSDNGRALRLYQRLGFAETSREPLVRVESGDRVEWVAPPPDHAEPIVRFNVRMRQARE